MEPEQFINEVSGCGQFQIWLTLITYVVKMPGIWGMLMLAVGSSNPGWFCADKVVENNTIETKTIHSDVTFSHPLTKGNTSMQSRNKGDLKINQCGASYKNCSNVQFLTDELTLVSDWTLVCDKSWIAPAIISIQMLGVAIGSSLSGTLADRYGRRKTLYFWLAYSVPINLLAAFSVSWQMLAPVMFFLGLGVGGNLALSQIYPLEFVNTKWRSTVGGLPSWHICATLLGLCQMILRNWRHVCMASAVLSAMIFLTVLWVPESLRWLLVHEKIAAANKVAKKMVYYNKSNIEGLDQDNLLKPLVHSHSHNRQYSLCNIFTSPLRKRLLALSVYFFFLSLAFYAINFGIGSLFGNVYINFIFNNIVVIPLSLGAPYLNNKIGRKRSLFACKCISLTTCVCIVIIDMVLEGQQHVITYLTLFISAWLQVSIMTFHTYASELFPTVVRIQCYGFALFVGRMASILAPYILPRDYGNLTASFSVLLGAMLVCTIAILALPETNKEAMQDSMPTKKEKTNKINNGVDTAFIAREEAT